MIDQSDQKHEIIDEAEAVSLAAKANMDVGDWISHCIQEIRSNMLYLDKSWKKITD